MSRFGWKTLTAGVIALSVAGISPHAQSASWSAKSPRITPPVVKPRLPNPVRRKPQNPNAGREKGKSPTASPDNRKAKPAMRRKVVAPVVPPPGPPRLRPEALQANLPSGFLLQFVAAGKYGYEPDIVLFLMSADTLLPQAEALAAENGLTVVDSVRLSIFDGLLLKARIRDDEQIQDVMQRFGTGNPDIFQSLDYRYGFSGNAQAAQSIQFAPQRMNVAEAHTMATGNAVKIAIIDTGIDDQHSELSGSIVERFDAVGAAPDAPTRHGTAMAGVIAAKDQITGIAPNVEILSAQAFAPPKKGESASGTTFAIIKSMDWAYRSGARVFNLSFAGPKDKLLIKALDALADHNTIMIGAAGNAGPGKPPAYPAAHDGVIAVTATDQNDALYAMANRGDYVAVAAPGVDIITTTPGGGYEFMSGTSIATAHVSGVVALVLERHPDLKADAVAQLLANASVDLGQKGIDSEFGAGLVNAAAALKSGDEIAEISAGGLTAGR